MDDDYLAKMEDVLEIYERPYDPQQPVVCLDEKPITLHADVRAASPAAPGREARRDNEYERCGTANVFCAVEPKAGRHFTFATPDRSGFESSGSHLGTGIPRSGDDPFGIGQFEHLSPQGTGGCVWHLQDQRLALRLFEAGVPLSVVESALLLASLRRLCRPADVPPLPRVRSLAYFQPVIEELQANPVPPGYLGYLRLKLRNLVDNADPAKVQKSTFSGDR